MDASTQCYAGALILVAPLIRALLGSLLLQLSSACVLLYECACVSWPRSCDLSETVAVMVSLQTLVWS